MLQMWLSEENKEMTQFNNLSVNKDATRGIITTVNGSFNKADNLLEQDVIEMLLNEDQVGITLDGVNLTVKTFFRLFEKVDGVTYQLIQKATFPDDFDGNAMSIGFDGKGRDQKVTVQSDALEGAIRAIPFSRVDLVRMTE